MPEVSPNDIEMWAESGDEKLGVPWLLKSLIQSSGPHEVYEYEIQTGNQIYIKGFDGYTVSRVECRWIPEGKTVWEIGTQKTGLNDKMRNDCAKRLRRLRKSARDYNFRFVTSSKWASGGDKATLLNKNERWKSTKCYTSSELADWVNEVIWVRHQFRQKYGLPTSESFVSFGTIYSEYIEDNGIWGAEGNAVPNDFVISNRKKYAEDIVRWILNDSSVKRHTRILFSSYLEAKHFIAASLAENVRHFKASPRSNTILWFEGAIADNNLSQIGRQHTVIVPSTHARQAFILSKRCECKIIVAMSKECGDSQDSLAKLPGLWDSSGNQSGNPVIPFPDVRVSMQCLLNEGLITNAELDKVDFNSANATYNKLREFVFDR